MYQFLGHYYANFVIMTLVCVCLSVSICLSVCVSLYILFVHGCASKWRPEVDIRCQVSSSIAVYFFETGSLTELG